ncbi:MAG: FGGY family carbohydrate kinase [Chloroflexi bacterium]|nr:FGGY family carbohydrate kinase [Chloroflexota bacterium]MCY4246376.1 FGGY family carbohydrate kinase [Chloroflexota bacterium]
MNAPWLVFDIGTGSAKAALIRDSRILATASAAYPTVHGAGGVVEQDAEQWWAAARSCCRDLSPRRLAGIALTGQMQDVVLLDESGEVIRPVILYSDTRARAEIEQIHAFISQTELTSLTGAQQTAGSILAKLRWLCRHERQSIARVAHLLLGGADFIAARLCGSRASDSTTAATTGLWRLAAGKLLDAPTLRRLELGWALPLLPRVVAGGAQVGALAAGVAKELGLPADLPVHLGPGDAGSATIGAGCGELGPAYAYVGSSGWVGFSAREIGDAAAGVMSLAHPRRGHVIQVVPMMTSAGNLSWLRDVFDSSDYDDIIAQGVSCPPGKLVFLPYLQGERAPFNDPLARGAFVGIAADTGRPQLVRAVLEGIIFAYRHTLSALSPQLPTHLTLIGGGARSDSLNQLFADILGLPVHLPPDVEHAGLQGAWQAAQVARGTASSFVISPASPPRILQPQTQHHPHYERQFQHYLAAYQALKPLFAQMARRVAP